MKVFEYALVRAVPRIERGECLNVGVIVYCQAADYLGAGVHVNEARLLALDPSADIEAVASAVDAIKAVCAGTTGPAAATSRGERFRWLTAPRSTVVQPGPVHSGLTEKPEAELSRLFDELVR
jgi:hypothetical protein